jgi:hypothetical protein
VLLYTFSRTFDGSVDEQCLLVFKRLCDGAASLIVVLLTPCRLLVGGLRRVGLSYPEACQAFGRFGSIVVDGSEVSWSFAERLAPCYEFRAPSLVDVSEAVHLRLCSGHGGEEARTACSGFVFGVV